jgi:hypothetical protein
VPSVQVSRYASSWQKAVIDSRRLPLIACATSLAATPDFPAPEHTESRNAFRPYHDDDGALFLPERIRKWRFFKRATRVTAFQMPPLASGIDHIRHGIGLPGEIDDAIKRGIELYRPILGTDFNSFYPNAIELAFIR